MSSQTRITEIKAANFKGLKFVALKTDRPLTNIGGKNEQGKSSLIDAIWAALGGARNHPDVPIREGENHAEVILELAECDVLPACKVHRQWFRRMDGKVETTLDVLSKDPDMAEGDGRGSPGFAKASSPQAMLDGLLSKVAFDPLAFLSMKPREQVEKLRDMVGIDFTQIDAGLAELEDRRKKANAKVELAESFLAKCQQHADVPAEPISVDALFKRLNEAKAHNDAVGERVRDLGHRSKEMERQVKAIKVADERIVEMERELEKLKRQRGELEATLDTMREEYETIKATAESDKYIDTKSIEREIQSSQDVNRKIEENAKRDDAKKELEFLKAEAGSLDHGVKKLRQKKIDMMKEAKWPVEGLGFDDKGLTYNGLPFKQASTSVQTRTSIKIGLADNPALPVMLVRRGSELDEDRLKELEAYAFEHSAQIFLERVSTGSECHVVMKEGEAVTVEAVS